MPFTKGHTTNLGRKLSEETRKKMSRAHKYLMPKEWGGGFQKGNIPWNSRESSARASYYAGLVDGEGYISIQENSPRESHRYHKVCVRITMQKKVAMEEGVKHWGGWLYERKNKNCWDWVLQSFYAAKFLKDISPYLKEKTEQAKIAVDFYGLQKRKSRQSVQKVSDEEIEYRKSIVEKLKSLHLNKGTHELSS